MARKKQKAVHIVDDATEVAVQTTKKQKSVITRWFKDFSKRVIKYDDLCESDVR